MTRRTDFRKAITYTGQKIKGPVDVTLKIDGVRILYRDDRLVTRNNKVPPGLHKICTPAAIARLVAFRDAEIYTGDFHEVQGGLSRHDPEEGLIGPEHIYPLDCQGGLDERLFVSRLEELKKDDDRIPALLKVAVAQGFEGIVLRTADHWYRVKPEATADVRITGWFEQHDKYKNPKGQLGGFETNYGKVTAFTEEMRKKLWDNPDQYIGRMMTVKYKELYETGKFRFAVTFLHFRDDKEEESFDTKAI